MSRFVITIVLTFLLERAASQGPSAECQSALSAQPTACAGVMGADICSGDCAAAFQAVINSCAPQFSSDLQGIFDRTCNINPTSTTAPPADSTAAPAATTSTTTAPTTAPPTCSEAMVRLGQNQRCFNLTTAASAAITASDCTACRTLFETVVTACGATVHVSGNKVRCYNEIDAVGECVTADGSKTRVHACVPMKGRPYGSGLPCGAFTTEKEGHPKVMRLKLSAQWFLLRPSVPKSSCVHFPSHNFYRVFHSMHASYNEIRSFVGYLQPKTIIPCVTALNDTNPMDVCSRLKDLLRANDNIGNDRKELREQNAANLSSPNKESSVDHTHWMSGDETDSEWVSQSRFTIKECAGTKRSLFLSDDSSQEQLTKRFLDDEADSDDHQSSLEISSYSLSDNSSHGNVSSQPHPPVQDPVTSLNSPEIKTPILHCSTPLKEQQPHLLLQTPAPPTHGVDSPPGKTHSSSAPITNAPSKTSPRVCCDDIIDLTQSDDDDSDVTYCSDAEDDHIFIDSEASLNPTRCDSPSPQLSANDQCIVLPATPEHSTVRTTSIVLSYHGVL